MKTKTRTHTRRAPSSRAAVRERAAVTALIALGVSVYGSIDVFALTASVPAISVRKFLRGDTSSALGKMFVGRLTNAIWADAVNTDDKSERTRKFESILAIDSASTRGKLAWLLANWDYYAPLAMRGML